MSLLVPEPDVTVSSVVGVEEDRSVVEVSTLRGVEMEVEESTGKEVGTASVFVVPGVVVLGRGME